MIRALWRHFSYNYREGGLRQIGHKIVWRAGQWVRSDVVWLVYHLDLRYFSMTPRLPLMEARMDFEQLAAAGYFKALAFPEAVQQKLASGCRCHGFFWDGQLANIGWTSCGYLEPEPGIRIIDKDSIGIHDCFTLPDFRSKGVYTDTLVRMLSGGRNDGALRALIAVDPVNFASIRAIEKTGFQPLYRLTIRRRFGRRLRRESPFDRIF